MRIEYSDPYTYADDKSALYQKWYFRLLIIEYFLLFVTAVNAIHGTWHKYSIAFTLLIVLIIIFSVKHFIPISSKWYRYRALSESIKTLSWRFMMKTEPFDNKPLIGFKLLKDNIHEIINDIGLKVDVNTIVTTAMKDIYKMNLPEKIDIYSKYRINDQYKWYSSKAVFNKRKARCFWLIIVILYVVSLVVSYINLNLNQSFFHISIFTTLISSILGWSQIKRYDELSSSYLLAAKEIFSMKESIQYIDTEKEFSDFVIEAEQAFSREHTQWTARRLIKIRLNKNRLP